MKLAAVGSNCVDFYNNIENGKAYPGGSPVNVAVYTVRLGGEASYTGPVGDDVYGKIMQEAIAAKGVDTSHLYVKPGKTAVSQVELLEGERVFGDYEEGVLEDYTLSEEDMDFIQTHDIVVCDLWGKVEGQFRALKARGIPTAFDCATRPEDEASRIAMPYTDYLFFSSDDGDTPALRDQMKGYHSRGPKLVIALLGEHGRRYVPYLMTVALYIACANLIGVFGIKPPTKDLNVTAALALMSICLIEYSGIHARGGKGFLKSLAAPTPIMTPMNILEIAIRPTSLCMRLFGNVLGAFVIMELIKLVVPVFVPAIFSLYFDLFDGLIQTYVFVFLTSLFMKESIGGEE